MRVDYPHRVQRPVDVDPHLEGRHLQIRDRRATAVPLHVDARRGDVAAEVLHLEARRVGDEESRRVAGELGAVVGVGLRETHGDVAPHRPRFPRLGDEHSFASEPWIDHDLRAGPPVAVENLAGCPHHQGVGDVALAAERGGVDGVAGVDRGLEGGGVVEGGADAARAQRGGGNGAGRVGGATSGEEGVATSARAGAEARVAISAARRAARHGGRRAAVIPPYAASMGAESSSLPG